MMFQRMNDAFGDSRSLPQDARSYAPPSSSSGARLSDRDRARFEAVRRRVFLEMKNVGSKWKLILIVPFHVAVIAILAMRGFPKDRLAIQIAAFVTMIAAGSIGHRLGGWRQ